MSKMYKPPLRSIINSNPLVHELVEELDRQTRFSSIRSFCRRVGICPTAFYTWRVGSRSPRLDLFQAAANALGFEVKLVRKKDEKSDS